MVEFNALKAKVDFSEVDKARGAFDSLKNEIPGAEAAVDGFKSVVDALANPLLAVGVALTTAAAGAIKLGFDSIDAADKLQKMAVRTGQSVEYLQSLGDVAKMAGTDLNSLTDVLDQIGKKSSAGGEEGKKTGKAYEYLGVQARDAAGNLKSATLLAEEGADALDRLGHSADANAAFQDAFGSSALKSLPALKGLNKAIDEQYEFLASVGALLDGNLTKASEAYNDQMSRLGQVFQGVGNDIARIMLPMLTGLADMLLNSAKNSGILSTAFEILKGVVWTITSALKGVLTFILMVDNGFANLVQSIQLGGKVIWAALSGNWDDIPKLWDGYKTRIVRTNEEAAAAVGKIWTGVHASPQSKDDFKKKKDVPTNRYDPFSKPEKAGHERVPTESGFKSAVEQQEKALAKLRSQYEAMFGIRAKTHSQMLEASIDAGKFAAEYDKAGKLSKKAATDTEIGILRTKAASADYLEEVNRRTKAEQDLWKTAEVNVKAEQEKATALRQTIATQRIGRNVLAQFGKTQEDVNIAISEYNISSVEMQLAIAKASGATEQEVYQLEKKLESLREIKLLQQDQKDDNEDFAKSQNTFGNGWSKAFSTYKKDSEDAAKHGSDMFNSATGKMGDALATFVTTGKLNFKSLAASILTDLAKIAMQKAIAGIVGSFFADGAAFSGGTKVFASGDVFNSPTSFPMAGNQRGIMGEAGPEAIMPLTRGQDGKLGVRAQGGGGSSNNTVVNNNLTVSIGSVDSEERKQDLMKALQQQMVAVSKQTMSNEMRQGGMLNRRTANA